MSAVLGRPIFTPDFAPVSRVRWEKWAKGAVIVAIVVVIGLGVASAVPYFFPKNFAVVEPGKIYRSGQLTGRMLRHVVAKDHIKVIVSLSTDETDGPTAIAEGPLARQLGVTRLTLPLSGDGSGDPENYVKAIAAIDQAQKQGQPVLVHCEAGTQRTGGVIAVYEILVKHEAPEKAWQEILRYGHNPKKNPILRPYVNQHMAEWARELADRKIIDHVPDPMPQLPQ